MKMEPGHDNIYCLIIALIIILFLHIYGVI